MLLHRSVQPTVDFQEGKDGASGDAEVSGQDNACMQVTNFDGRGTLLTPHKNALRHERASPPERKRVTSNYV
jgi:hypothetical protein